MRRRAVLLLWLATMLGACGSIDGGSSGTGITTAEGNVISVVASARTSTQGTLGMTFGAMSRAAMGTSAGATDLSGIDVAVEGTSFAATTDQSGAFAIHGRFAAVFTLVFSRPDTGSLGRLTVTIPAGGTLTMNDVTIVVAQQAATAASQDAVFECTIASADCPGETLSLVNEGKPYNQGQYVLDLAGSSIQGPMGEPVPCEALRSGDNASVRGQALPDLTFGNAVVTVSR
jgi:hypothetical protein